ncbi:hypothetical protein AX16_000262 [Volvariella volvacea WC 439]|nr:hypothetical protein AX16_000262 [Volvariella volvacea WC 439]
MAAFKILNLLAVSSLALIVCSFSAVPVTALSAENGHAVRHFRPHEVMLKKKRDPQSRRCRPRPSSSAEVPTAQPTPEVPPPQPTPPPESNPPDNNNNNGGGSDNGGDNNNTGGDSNTGGNNGDTGNDQPAPSPPPPPSSGNTGRKVGIAWPINDDVALSHMKTDKVGPVYTWSPWIPQGARSLGYETVAMLWGDKQIADFQRLVQPGYADVILGFNEPNQHDQANMSPEHAAAVWRQYIDPLKDYGMKLVTPACTNAPDAIDWYNRFFQACQGCTFHAMATHFYGTSADQLIAHLQQYHDLFGLPLWLTEFACQDFSGRNQQASRDEIFAFMRQVKDFMDSTPWVEKYFAFGAMHDMYNVNPLNQLLAPNGYPTDLGYMYIN